jgi:hypothetical protein
MEASHGDGLRVKSELGKKGHEAEKNRKKKKKVKCYKCQ